MKLLMALLFTIGFSGFAMAEEEASGPCHDDVQKFCKDVKPGKGRIMKCIKQHESEISQECKNHRAKMKEEHKGMHDACAEDMKTHCGDVKPGGGAKMKCVKENKEKFSKECQDSMDKMKEQYHRK